MFCFVLLLFLVYLKAGNSIDCFCFWKLKRAEDVVVIVILSGFRFAQHPRDVIYDNGAELKCP